MLIDSSINPVPGIKSTRFMWLSVGLLVLGPSGAWFASHVLGITLRVDSIAMALWVLALAPMLEELAFRPLLQRGLFETLRAKVRHAAHLANLITALAFVASHLPAQGMRALLWIGPAWVLGEVWRRTERLWVCVLAHGWFNGCLVWASVPN